MVIGGRRHQGAAMYNDFKDLWYTVAPLKFERRYSAAVKWNGTVVVTGGSDPVSASVELFNPKTNKWTAALPDLLVARYGHALVNIDSCLYAIGGKSQDEQLLSSVEKYSLTSKSWKLVFTLPTARSDLTCVTRLVSTKTRLLHTAHCLF